MPRKSVVERRQKIARMILRDGQIRVSEVAGLFGVSTETVRKDLLYLDQQGMAKKGHGGALAVGESSELNMRLRATENLDRKSRIAEKALEFIPQEAIVGLDTGSTNLCLARLLKARKGLTIITNSLLAANELADSENAVYLTGGSLKGNLLTVTGMWALDAINSVRPHVSFVGSSGVFSHGGPCSTSFDEVEIKKAFILNSSMSVVLMDSTKFYQNSLIQCVGWEQVDVLITDSGMPREEREKLSVATRLYIIDETEGTA